MGEPKLEEVFKYLRGADVHVRPADRVQQAPLLRCARPDVAWPRRRPVGYRQDLGRGDRAAHPGFASATKFSARKKADVEYIDVLPTMGDVGLVIVDDFHRLPDETKQALADYLKTLADEEQTDVKIVVVGINRAGERLVGFAADLVNRIDVIRFENNPEHKVAELVRKGEAALDISINVVDEIVAASQGSFYVAQLLAHEVCLKTGVTERARSHASVDVSFEGVRASVWDRLRMTFYEPCRRFCQGSKMKSAGRAPYLHILHALAEGEDWSLDLRDLRKFGPLRGSVGQVVEKGFLKDLIRKTPTYLASSTTRRRS